MDKKVLIPQLDFGKNRIFFSVIGICIIVVLVFTGTVSRYAFNAPIFGIDRAATYLMVWIGFFGFQMAYATGRHIEIGFFKKRLSVGKQHFLNIVGCFINAIFMCVMAYISMQYIVESYELGDYDLVLEIPFWFILSIIPFSLSVTAIRSLFMCGLWWEVYKGNLKEEVFIKKSNI